LRESDFLLHCVLIVRYILCWLCVVLVLVLVLMPGWAEDCELCLIRQIITQCTYSETQPSSSIVVAARDVAAWDSGTALKVSQSVR
jgi:hypothetical protein